MYIFHAMNKHVLLSKIILNEMKKNRKTHYSIYRMSFLNMLFTESYIDGKVIKRRMEVMSRKNRIIISFVEECGYEGTRTVSCMQWFNS